MENNKKILNFFDKYQKDCREFNRGPIHIPKPDPENGTHGRNIVLMFINERPGRIGPGQTDRISFNNQDPTAGRFKRLFNTLSVDRKNIFITNACIYYPSEEDYRDMPPTRSEEVNFSAKILEDQVRRVNPKILVPLGNTALRTLRRFIPELHGIRLKNDVARMIEGARLIFPLYHTSNRAAVTREEKYQKKDWVKLREFL